MAKSPGLAPGAYGATLDERMSDIFFEELGIPAPDINLGVGSGSHAVQTANIMARFEPICQQERPSWVVVVGDVNSTMACTLVCSKMGIRVAHVEAGLRSFDRTMPEEVNRIVTDSLADLLLTPSADADENLKREGIADSKIRLVGNVMIDTLVANLEKARANDLLVRLGLRSGGFVYATLHRPSNVDHQAALKTIMNELKRLATQIPVVFPIHPRTHKTCGEFGIALDNQRGLRILEPIGYLDSLCLTENARLVLTDSGGLQEESTASGRRDLHCGQTPSAQSPLVWGATSLRTRCGWQMILLWPSVVNPGSAGSPSLGREYG